MKPYCSSIAIVPVLMGNTENRSFDPSSGGNGMRLKNAKSTFQKITIMRSAKKIDPNEPETVAEICDHEALLMPVIMAAFTATGTMINFAKTAETSAITMFEAGPPKATIAGPHFWFRRLYGLYGTGFAQPKANPVVTSIASGTMIDPQMSMWLIGLKFSRPEYFAVASPSQSATKPCETSWTMIEYIRIKT